MLVKEANDYIIANKHTINTKYKPEFHFSSPLGWINDPNGFSFYKNSFHLFFQFHPYSEKWGPMHWGHAISNNLLDWKYINVALAPLGLDKPDNGACFSGCALPLKDQVKLFYTEFHNGEQRQVYATSKDGYTFHKPSKNIIIDYTMIPKEYHVPKEELRDPFLFKRDNTYYCLLAALDAVQQQGLILLFSSNNLIDWSFSSVLMRGDKAIGRMWECPQLARINHKDVLIVSIQDMIEKNFNYQNNFSSLYFVGDLNNITGTFTVEHVQEIDEGFEFYAPQVLSYKKKHYLISWLESSSRSTVLEDLNHGYAGVFSLPRELSIKDNVLIQKPLAILSSRFQYIKQDSFSKSTELSLNHASSFQITFKNLMIKDNFSIQLLNEKETLTMTYYYKTQILELDRSKSGHLPNYTSPFDNASNKRTITVSPKALALIDIVFDCSIFESFFDGYSKSMSAKVYPDNPFTNIKISSSNIGGTYTFRYGFKTTNT